MDDACGRSRRHRDHFQDPAGPIGSDEEETHFTFVFVLDVANRVLVRMSDLVVRDSMFSR
jgi:hypothetical protein